jgi:flagellar motor component MotA
MILSYVRIFVLVAISCVFTMYTSGGTLNNFFDLPSLAIAVILPFVYQWCLFGAAGLKNAFSAGYRKELSLEDAEKARLFFRTYTRICWFAVGMAVIIGMVSILRNLEDRTALGPNMALSFISLFYVALINVLVILPNATFIKKRLLELSAEI